MYNLWDKRAEESEQAFAAFVMYRDMGAERSTAKVGQRLGKSRTLMDRWSARHQWVERAHAYDKRQDRVRVEAANKAIVKATEKAVTKRELTKERVLEETATIAFSRLTRCSKLGRRGVRTQTQRGTT